MRHLRTAFMLFGVIAVCSSQPKITVNKEKIDLGVIYNGTTVDAHIVVKNMGRDTLRILGVTTSCGCTTVRQPKAILQPGESDVVEVQFNSTGFRGKVEKHVFIASNDRMAPSMNVTMTGDVIEELQPVDNNSSVVWLGSVPVGKTIEKTVSFKNISGRVITLLGFKSSTTDISVSFAKQAVLPADTISMTFKVTPHKTDYISEQVLLQTDSKKQSQVPVRVTLIGVFPN
jgi:hypothetical protein